MSRTSSGMRRRQRAGKTVGRVFMLAAALLLSASLAGCVYSQKVTKDGNPPTGEYVQLVQGAVDRYKEQTGVLPIKTRDQTTPIYEKYPIDFKKLQDAGVLSTVPGNAFERGGTAMYVLVDVENDPAVKMIDLVLFQKMTGIQQDVEAFMRKTGRLPAGPEVSPGIYRLDAEALGKKDLTVRSPYSRTPLSLLIDENGKVAVDYALEIMQALQRTGLTEPDADLDLREVLTEAAVFAPVYSFPYRWQNGEPVPQME